MPSASVRTIRGTKLSPTSQQKVLQAFQAFRERSGCATDQEWFASYLFTVKKNGELGAHPTWIGPISDPVKGN